MLALKLYFMTNVQLFCFVRLQIKLLTVHTSPLPKINVNIHFLLWCKASSSLHLHLLHRAALACVEVIPCVGCTLTLYEEKQ